jgi:hypothetical protein
MEMVTSQEEFEKLNNNDLVSFRCSKCGDQFQKKKESVKKTIFQLKNGRTRHGTLENCSRICAMSHSPEKIKKKCEKYGYTFISVEKSEKIRNPIVHFYCKCGNISKDSLHTIKEFYLYRCNICKEKKHLEERKVLYYKLLNIINEKQYILLDKDNYIINHDNLPIFLTVKCNNGHIYKKEIYRILKGKLSCKTCVLIERGGDNSPWYIDGRSKNGKNGRVKDNSKIQQWKRKVVKKFGYQCDICGEFPKEINAHHLNSYDWDVKNRFNVDNGIPLCPDHHIDFHNKYGRGGNTKEQYEEYYKKQTTPIYLDWSDWI